MIAVDTNVLIYAELRRPLADECGPLWIVTGTRCGG